MHLYCFWVRERACGPTVRERAGAVQDTRHGCAAQERNIAQEGRDCARERVGDGWEGAERDVAICVGNVRNPHAILNALHPLRQPAKVFLRLDIPSFPALN